MRTRAILSPLLLLAVGCSGSTTNEPGPMDAAAAADATAPADASAADSGAPEDAGPADTGPACETIDGDVVQLTTEDGVQLEADLYTTGTAGGPAVVLLHMIPPFNDRTNYPRGFIRALVARGMTVINVDRRGAGNSQGDPEEAYTGPNGKFDAKAAVDFLLAHACAPDPSKLALVGASNGTTTAFDYTVFAEGSPSPRPAALVFLTGGQYTETNNRISAQRAILDTMPIQFVFSTEERAWSAGFESGAPNTWQFEEYDPGAHGTRMFGRAAQSQEDVANFLQTTLQ